ncbi:dihydroneopterin aldolase, partial [Acidimicrobiaceae bacterium]|nr:dihydroneopterin aldolase [Acidimicrobiaceae bacterium]
MSFDIKIDGIKTFGKHGVYDFEKKEEQLFLIDLQINLNSDIVVNDSIDSTIDYEEYIEKVEHLVSS